MRYRSQYKLYPKNRPIATLIKEFSNKKSGKVSVARREIIRRFDGLDWKDQKKILNICLDSLATDRQWAYTKLSWLWDKSFEEKVRRMWEDTHEPKSQWPIIHHFPVEYIIQHINDFSDGDYYFIYLRLVEEVPNIEIDKERLTPLEYLKVLSRGNRTIEDEAEALDLLYLTIANIGTKSYHGDYVAMKNKQVPDELYHVMNYVRYLGQRDVVVDFEEWYEEVIQRIQDGLKQLQEEDIEDYGLPGYKMLCEMNIIKNVLSSSIDKRYFDAVLEKNNQQEERLKAELETYEPEEVVIESPFENCCTIPPSEYDSAKRKMIEQNKAMQILFDELELDPDNPPF